MYNRIILIGRLTRDPEANYTPSGVPVTKFSLAIDRPQSAEARQQGREKETDFVDIVTWRQTAEFAANYLQKGRLTLVEGRLQIRSYVAQDGQQRKATEVQADTVRGLERARDGEGEGESPSPSYGGGGASQPRGNYGGGGDSQGGYNQSSGNGGGYGGGNAPAPAAPRPPAAESRPPASTSRPAANRPPARPAPAPASNDSYDDMDDLADPFAE